MKFIFLIFTATLLFSSQSKKSSEEYLLGKKLYFETCAACHGEKGVPNRELNLAVKPRNLNKTILLRTQIHKIIKNGAREYGAHSDIMPAFKYLYDDKTLDAITTYVYEEFAHKTENKIKRFLREANALSKNEQRETLVLGKRIFDKTCSKCHGETGNADSLYVKGSKVDKDFIYPYNLTKILLNEDQIFLFSKFGSYFWGSDKSDMPAWKKRYSDKELKSVAKFIQESIKKN